MQDQRSETKNSRGQEKASAASLGDLVEAVERASGSEPLKGNEGNYVPGSRDWDGGAPRLESQARNAAFGAAWQPEGSDGCSLGPVEHNNSWGDFEGFSETSDKSDTFNTLDILERWAAPGTRESDPDLNGCAASSCGSLQFDSRRETAAVSPSKVLVSNFVHYCERLRAANRNYSEQKLGDFCLGCCGGD